MIRASLQCVLCLSLGPLLTAQQVAPADVMTHHDNENAVNTQSPLLARGSEIQLVLLENVSSATAVNGKKVRMAVARDVMVDGQVVIERGTTAEGVVTTLRRAVKGKHDGRVWVKAVSLVQANGGKLKLQEYPPGEDRCGDMGPCWAMYLVLAPLAIALSPLMLSEAIDNRKTKHEGKEMVLRTCSPVSGYIAKSTRLAPLAPLNEAGTDSTRQLNLACPVEPAVKDVKTK